MTQEQATLHKIVSEIEEAQRTILDSAETPTCDVFNISIGLSMALRIIEKYTE